MPTERIDEIRERAYCLWQADGSPDGRDMDYWLRAERDLTTATRKPGRKAKGAGGSTSTLAAKTSSNAKTAAKPRASSKRTTGKKAQPAKA